MKGHLLNVFPSQALQNLADGVFAYAKLTANGLHGLARSRHLPDATNSVWCQLRIWPLLTEMDTALRQRIIDVVARSSKKQMAGVYASTDVACMQHVQIKRNRPIHQLPREPMGAAVERSVAVSEQSGRPQPTCFSLLNLFKKPLGFRPEPRFVPAGRRTEPAASLPYFFGLRKEYAVALGASPLNLRHSSRHAMTL